MRAVVLRGGVDIGQAELVQQQRVERPLERADADEAAIGAAVDVVERRIVERARRGAIELAAGAHPLRDRAEHAQHVDDRRVDDTAATAGARVEQCADDAESEAERAGCVANDRRRHDRPFAAVCRERQQPAQRHIVQVVAGRLRQRPALPPAGDAAVDQPRVARRAVGRAEAQALHRTGPQAFDQGVASVDQAQRLRCVGAVFQVERQDILAAAQRAVRGAAELFVDGAGLRPGDDGDRGAHVGQHPASQRARADALEFEDPHPRQRRRHASAAAEGVGFFVRQLVVGVVALVLAQQVGGDLDERQIGGARPGIRVTARQSHGETR